MPISRRAFEILELLIEHHGEIVTKDEIFARVWHGLFVDESNLPVHISALRKALGPDRDIVKTIPGRGYLFTADVTIVGGEAGPATPGGAAPEVPTNLPQLGPLIGRADELAALEAGLAGTRLLTLVGMGGIGKTRLAVALAWQTSGDFPDGIWLVDLAPLTTAEDVAIATATALGVAVPNSETAADAIASAIGRRTMALVFDNCEHLVDAAAALIGTLLRRSANLRVIAGSQTRLGLELEQVHRLKPLDLPLPGTREIDGYGAADLFAARASASDRRFRIDSDNAPTVAEICRRLEGIPLALEMAAARIPLLGLEGLRTGLDERLRMLKFGGTDAGMRHRTLRATVEWSHSLLDPAERRLFRRLAIFAGSFALDAAVAMADEDVDRWDVVDTLGRLLDKSMIVIVDGSDPSRYRLLETLRLFGLEQLAATGETAAMAERHARHFTALFVQAEDQLRHMQSERWLEIYRPEIDNVRAALKWTFERPERAGMAITLAGASARLWHTLNLIGEGKHHLARADALVDDDTPRADVARLLMELASISRNSDRAHALGLAEKSAVLYRELDDRPGLAAVLLLQGMMQCFLGRPDDAGAAFQEARAMVFPGELSQLQIAVTSLLALRANMLGQPLEARRWYSESLGLAREFNENIRVIHALQGLAEVEFVLGEFDSAIERARQVVDLARSPKYRSLVLDLALINLGAYLLAQGRLAGARPIAKEAFDLVLDEGGYILTVCQEQWALIGALDGRHGDAAELIGYIDGIYAVTGDARQPTEQFIYNRLMEVLSANLPAAEIERRAAEGRQWTEDQARLFTIDRFISAAA